MTNKQLENFAEEMGKSVREAIEETEYRFIIYFSVIHFLSIACIWFITKN